MAMNEWGNYDTDICQPRAIIFQNLLINLFKQRYTSSFKSYKYLNKFIS